MSILPSTHPLPELSELLSNFRVVSVPMSVRFRGLERREAALLEGPAGWGEFSAFLEYAPAEASRWLQGAIESAYAPLAPKDLRDVPVNATLPAVNDAEVENVLKRYGEHLFESDGRGVSIKVKVAEQGQDLKEDVTRLRRVRALLPQAQLRIDANAGWSEDEALVALEALAVFGLQYAEQPVSSVASLRRVREHMARRQVPVPIAADESIRKAEDPLKVAQEEAADLVIIKYAPLGGARKARQILKAAGLPAVVSSAIDTSIGLSAGVRLSAVLREEGLLALDAQGREYAQGLGTGKLLLDDVLPEPLHPRPGSAGPLSLPVKFLAPDPLSLTRLEASPERYEHWESRIRSCYQYLQDARVA